MITLSGKSRKLKACRISARYLFARAFFKNVRPGITIGVIAGREQVEKYMSGAWWNNDPVIAARNIHIEWEVFRMTTETIVCFLFWYMYAGSCSARLHRSLGYGRHYDTAHYILYMTAVMLFWPVTLPAATDIVADRLKKRR